MSKKDKDKATEEVAPKKVETKTEARFSKPFFVNDQGFSILDRVFYERVLEDDKLYTIKEANEAVEAFKIANKKEG